MVTDFLNKLLGYKKAPDIEIPDHSLRYGNVEDFRNYVADCLSKREEVEEITFDASDDLVINAKIDSDEIHKIYIGNLAGRIESFNPEKADIEVANFIDNILHNVTRNEEVRLHEIYANIRPVQYLEDNDELKTSILYENFLADIFIMYHQNLPGGLSSIANNDPVIPKALPDIKTVALKNIDLLIEDLNISIEKDSSLLRDTIGYFSLEEEALSPALLLSTKFKSILDDYFPNGFLITIPTRYEVVVISKDHTSPISTARKIIDNAFENDPYLISEFIFEFKDDELSVVKEV